MRQHNEGMVWPKFSHFFRFGDVSTDAESTARKLISVTSELDSTGAQVLQKIKSYSKENIKYN